MLKFRLKHIELLLLITLLANIKSFAQEMLGITTGNYSGIAGTMLNPANITTNKVYLDINIASSGFFVKNNFAYLPNDDFVIWDLFKSGYNFPTYGPNEQGFLYYDNENLKFATINTRIMGPSAMLQYGDHAFGIQTGIRYFASGNQIPWEIPVFGYNGLEYKPLQNIEFIDYDFDFSTSSWFEAGLSYAYNIYNRYDRIITIGTTVKRLWGYAGSYVKVNEVDYVVENDSTINIINLNAEVGYSLPIDYNTNDFTNSPTFRGNGIGLDLGMVFTKKKKFNTNKWRSGELCSQEFEDYYYKIGISILDIGRVKYKTNAQLHTYNDVSKYWPSIDTIDFHSMNSFFEMLSDVFYNHPDASLTETEIKIGLPTALSLQTDVNLNNKFYLAGMWIHPLRLNRSSLRRTAQLAIVPRYENKYFEVNLPVSVIEYRYPRVGLSARFYFFTIGTERLGTYLGMANMDGLDFYVSLKFGIDKGSCKSNFGGACSNASFGNKMF